MVFQYGAVQRSRGGRQREVQDGRIQRASEPEAESHGGRPLSDADAEHKAPKSHKKGRPSGNCRRAD